MQGKQIIKISLRKCQGGGNNEIFTMPCVRKY